MIDTLNNWSVHCTAKCPLTPMPIAHKSLHNIVMNTGFQVFPSIGFSKLITNRPRYILTETDHAHI